MFHSRRTPFFWSLVAVPLFPRAFSFFFLLNFFFVWFILWPFCQRQLLRYSPSSSSRFLPFWECLRFRCPMWPLLCLFVGGAAFAVRRGLRLAAQHALQQQQQQALGRAGRRARAPQRGPSDPSSSRSSSRDRDTGGSESSEQTPKLEDMQDMLLRRWTEKFSSYTAQWRLVTRDLRGFETPMSKAEAYQILRLTPAATKEKVLQTHKQLMLRNHPDNGGSTYVATKVNEAKDKLLKP